MSAVFAMKLGFITKFDYLYHLCRPIDGVKELILEPRNSEAVAQVKFLNVACCLARVYMVMSNMVT